MTKKSPDITIHQILECRSYLPIYEKRQGAVKILGEWYLQSNVRRNIQITGNSVIDTQSNNLGRYGMLTLTYNIQNFGQKVGGRQTFFNF